MIQSNLEKQSPLFFLILIFVFLKLAIYEGNNFLVIKEEYMNTKWLQELDVNNWVRSELSKI